MQQQKESILFINRVIESLDGFFGQIVEPTVFITDRICAEASMFLFKYFSNANIFGEHVPITGLKIKKELNKTKFETYCKSNGLSETDIDARLKVLSTSKDICIKNLQKEFKIPRWEDFWLELKKETLLGDLKEHMFINTLKMPRLSASKFDKFKLQSKEQILDNRIYKHLFVTDSEWCEVDKDEIKKNIKNIGRELFDLLIENHIICETESGILSEIFYKNFGIKFQQFFKVKMDDLIRYGIPEDEADAIFQKLVNEHILVKLDNDNYQLSSFIMESETPEWYNYIVMKMIKQKLAFGYAYLLLKSHNQINKETLLKLSLLFNDETFITELTDAGILEKSNINLLNLNKVQPATKFIRKQWERFFETQAAFNILKALEDAEEFIEKTFGEENVGFSIKRSKWYKKILPHPDVEKINEIFNEFAPVNQKWETFDIKLIPIKETMLHESENSHLMIIHGLTHLINFHDKKWSKTALKNAAGITVIGFAEFAFGCILSIPFTAFSWTGIAAVGVAILSKSFTIEGVNDMLFGLKSFYTGHCNGWGWAKYKMINMALNLTFIGGTQMLKFMKFAEFSYLKAIFSRTDAAISGIANTGRHALTSISSSFFNIKENEDKFIFAQKATIFVVEEIYKLVQNHITTIFESNEHSNKLFETVKQYLQKFGCNSNFIIDNEIFDKFVQPAMLEICYTILAALRTSIMEDKEVKKENIFEVIIKKVIHSEDFKKLLQTFSEKLSLSIKQLRASLINKFNRKNEETNFTVEDKAAETQTILLMDKWKSEIQERCKSLIKENVEIPINYENEAEYQKQLDSIVKEAYLERQEHGSSSEVKIYDNNFKTNSVVLLSKKIADELKMDFFKMLQQVLETTQDPGLYAAALINGTNIDFFGAKIMSDFLSSKFSKTIVITTYGSIAEENSDIIKIIIDQNYDASKTTQTIFEQISQHLPEFKNFYGNKTLFQNALANEIAKKSLFFTRNKNVSLRSYDQIF